MSASFAEHAWNNDQRISKLTGLVFSETYREQILNRATPFDSFNAVVALAAVRGLAAKSTGVDRAGRGFGKPFGCAWCAADGGGFGRRLAGFGQPCAVSGCLKKDKRESSLKWFSGCFLLCCYYAA